MANSLYVILIKWEVTEFNPPLIEAVISNKGEWLRISGWSWLFWTNLDSTAIRNIIRKHLDDSDSLLVLRVKVAADADIDGWLPRWAWDWIYDKLKKQEVDNPLIKFKMLSPPGGLSPPDD